MPRIMGRREFLGSSAGFFSAALAGQLLRPLPAHAAPIDLLADNTFLRIVVDDQHGFSYRGIRAGRASNSDGRYDGGRLSLLLESGLNQTQRPLVLNFGHSREESLGVIDLVRPYSEEIDALVIGDGRFENLGRLIDFLGHRRHATDLAAPATDRVALEFCDCPVSITGRALATKPMQWTSSARLPLSAFVPDTPVEFAIKGRLLHIALAGRDT